METVINFEKMSSGEKINLLRNIFDQQRRVAEENLNGWLLDKSLFDLNRVYNNHQNEILNKLCDKKSKYEILKIILDYF